MSFSGKICIDGMNLALQKGTGVATYAKNLAYVFSDQGNPVSLLYGQDVPVGDSPYLSGEVFLNLLSKGYKNTRPRFYERRWLFENYNNIFGHKAVGINLNKCNNHPLPPYCNLYNINSLFRAAHGFFRTTGRFIKVELPKEIEIMHWTYPVPIQAVGVKNLYTFHDLVPLLYPEMTLDNTELYKKMLSWIVYFADGICTVSETSKKDIESFFPKVRGKIFNTYQARMLEREFSLCDHNKLKEFIFFKIGLDIGEYYIHYGQIEPKKNTYRIIEAFLSSSISRKLIVIGSNGWKGEDAHKLLRKGVEMGKIIHIPYLEEKELFYMLRGARALFFPSIIEGFGLPVLEAFALAVPVLTSNNGALKEVAEDAAILVDPYDVRDIKNAMTILDEDDDLCLQLARAGMERGKFFSMEAYTQRLKYFYDNI